MSPNFKKLLFIYILFIFMAAEASAIGFERREEPEKEYSIYTFPAPIAIPGVQNALVVGTLINNLKVPWIKDGYFDIIGGLGWGEGSKWFEGKKFKGGGLAILDFPLISSKFTFSPSIEYVELFAYPISERGINSDPDKTLYLLGERAYSFIGELSYYFFNKQLELFYTYFKVDFDPYGYVDYKENFINAGNAGMSDSPHVDRFGILIDDTDNRRDPRIGYSIQFDRWDWPSRWKEEASFFQYDLDISGYIPIQEQKLIFVANQFVSTSKIKTPGQVDRYICNEQELSINPACQGIVDIFYENALEESKKPKGTGLGGRFRLRGYREGRFFDSHTNFRALELRWYFNETQIDFDYILQKGVFAGFQFAIFYEQGTVSPDLGHSFWENFKDSYGVAFRGLFNSVVFRADLGFSDEGSALTIWYGHPF